MTAYAPVIAYNPVHIWNQQIALRSKNRNVSFFSVAYADNAAQQQCMSSFSPIPPDSDDPLIQEAERFLDIVLECFIKTRVDEARIAYEKADGFFEKPLALANYAMYEGVYYTLAAQKNTAIMFLNCLDAAVTGSNSSKTGLVCDFITGLLAIGDIRDLLIQSWHYYTDSDDYDPLTMKLAAVGLVADVLQLIPAATIQMGTVNAVAASGKTVAKFIKKLGQPAKTIANVIGNHLGKILDDDSLSAVQKADKMVKIVPFLQIGVSATLIYEDDPAVFKVLAYTVTSAETYENLLDWLDSYLPKIESGLVAQHANPVWDAFFSPAYASFGSEIREKFILKFRQMIDNKKTLKEGITEQELAEIFTKSLDQFIKLVKKEASVLKEIPDDMKVIRAFIKLHEVGGVDAIKRIAKNGGWSVGIGKLFKNEHLVKAIDDIDLSELSDQAKTGLRQVLSNVGTQFNTTKGAIGHLVMIAEIQKAKLGKIENIEFHQAAKKANDTDAVLAPRRIDIVITLENGRKIEIEVKNYDAKNLDANLDKLMSLNVERVADDTLEEVSPGQLMNDLVRYVDGGYSGKSWWFTPAAMVDAANKEVKYTDGELAARAAEITQGIKQRIERNQKEIAKRFFNLNTDKPGDFDRWLEKKDELFDALDGNGPDGLPFVKVSGFNSIIE